MNGRRHYLIKWKNFSSRYNSWEPLSNLFKIADLLLAFEKEHHSLIKKKEEEWSRFYLSGQVSQPLDNSEV